MRTLLAVAGFTLALGIAPVAEEALSRVLRALVDTGSQRPCSMAARQPILIQQSSHAKVGNGKCGQDW